MQRCRPVAQIFVRKPAHVVVVGVVWFQLQQRIEATGCLAQIALIALGIARACRAVRSEELAMSDMDCVVGRLSALRKHKRACVSSAACVQSLGCPPMFSDHLRPARHSRRLQPPSRQRRKSERHRNRAQPHDERADEEPGVVAVRENGVRDRYFDVPGPRLPAVFSADRRRPPCPRSPSLDPRPAAA